MSALQGYEFWVSLGDECLYIRILALSLQRLEFWPYLSKHENAVLIPPNIGILSSSDPILLKTGILALPPKHWNSGLIPPKTGILTLSFQTWEFCPYPSKHWYSVLIFPNIRILALSFQTLEFWPYPSKHWGSDLILRNIGILTLSF